MLGALPALTYYCGLFVSYDIYMHRAGLMSFKKEHIDWREFIIPNLNWFLMTIIKALFWPIVLCMWFIKGRPPSRWKAYTQLEGHAVRAIKSVRPGLSDQAQSDRDSNRHQ